MRPSVWCLGLVALCGVAGQTETCDAGACGNDGAAAPAAPKLLADVCVRGVEIAPPGSKVLTLKNLTTCAVASLLAPAPGAAGPSPDFPLDEAAAAAVLRADALVLQDGLPDAAALAASYGRLLRGGGNVILPARAAAGPLQARLLRGAGFVEAGALEGFAWWRRRPDVAGGAAALRVTIVGPRDGEVFAFSDDGGGAGGGATIRVRVRAPPRDALALLPSPTLQLAADPDNARPLVVPLPHPRPARPAGGAAPAGDGASLAAPSAHEDDVELTLSNVPVGSHLITASLAFGAGALRRVVADAETSTMIDVVPGALLEPPPSLAPSSLGCARARAAPTAARAPVAEAPNLALKRRKLRVAFADLTPPASVDGQRRVWLQRCGHWNRMAERPFDLTYLLLYDDVTPPLRTDAPLRRAIAAAGVRASAVAAPWHLGNRLKGGDSAGAVLGAALECARGAEPTTKGGARRAWVSFLNTSVDVLLTHAAPGMGGALGDAARLGCLGRLAELAGVGARLVELPTLPAADLLSWRGAAAGAVAARTRADRLKADQALSAADWADALIVPSHFAARATLKSLAETALETPVVVLQPGVDDEWFRAGAKRRDDPKPGRTAVWVGRLDADKSPLLFVRACALAAQKDAATRCLIVGDGPLQAALAARASALAPGLRHVANGTTRFLGSAADDGDLSATVAAADVLVSTSVFPETFGLAPLEAAAAGLPVIAFGVAGMEEHVCDGVTAVVPRAPTPDALAKAMTGLLDDAGRARELGRNGAAAAATHFGAAGAASRAALFIRRAFDAFSGEFFPSFFLFRSEPPCVVGHDAECAAIHRRGNASAHCLGRPRLSPVYDAHSFLADVSVSPFEPPSLRS